MSAETINTVVKLLETLPDTAQNQVAEYLKNYIADLQDELQWDETFANTQNSLMKKARLAKQQIAEGLAKPLDLNQL